MSEILFLSIGYFLGAALSSGANFKNPDRILKWDADIFAWRPISPGSDVNADETILFAFEMKKNIEGKTREEG